MLREYPHILVTLFYAYKMARHHYDPFDGLRGKPLTEREITVLRLYSRGLTVAQIAAKIFKSDSTVRKDLRKVICKLGAPTITCALVKTEKLGLL